MTKMYEAKNHLLIHTGYVNPAEHRHMAAYIIISMEGKMIVSSVGKEYLSRGVMIPTGALHQIDTKGKPALVFLYDSTTNVAMQIKDVQDLPETDCDKIVDLYFQFQKNETVDAYNKFEQCCLEQIGITETKCCITDERIISAINYISSNVSEKITCRAVADSVFLSQGRFSHLFKNHVGMTFAAYLIYQRIMYVYTKILLGRSVTEAALEAGFSSSTHFADVNRRVFGLSASNITHDLIFRKVQ